jgi:SAM-dependent methyltransferase
MSAADGTVAIWHDVECGGYDADLALWEELASEATGPVLDLGCGTGRVALHLARRGHEVTGLDVDTGLIETFAERAVGLPAHPVTADACDFDLGAEFGLALAPMQLVQLLDTPADRLAFLSCVASHLRPDGVAALAIVEGVLAGVSSEGEAVPDAREVDGWLYASLPLETELDADRILIRRLRKTVSPGGELSREPDEVCLRVLSAEDLEREAATVGLRSTGRLKIDPTDAHVGSTVVLLRREA